MLGLGKRSSSSCKDAYQTNERWLAGGRELLVCDGHEIFFFVQGETLLLLAAVGCRSHHVLVSEHLRDLFFAAWYNH